MPHVKLELDQCEHLIKNGDWAALLRAIQDMDPADTADLLEALDAKDRERLFKLLDSETASEVLVELDAPFVDDVVDDMPTDKLADLADRMAPDDAVRILTDLDDEEKSAEVLAGMKASGDVSGMMRYGCDSAGQLMTTEVFSMAADCPIRQVREALVNYEPTDPVFYVYAIDAETGKLLGLASVKAVFTAGLNATLRDALERDYVHCHVNEDQEHVAHKFRKYDVWVMPVVDENHRLVGRITADDIMDVLHEEADEDLAAMVGAPDIERDEDSPFAIARLRFPWLMVTMAAGLVNSIIIKSLLQVTANATLAIFVPAIMAMGGNTGMQSSAVTIRGIALGQRAYNRLGGLIVKEVSAGLLMGLACGMISGSVIWLFLTVTGADTGTLNAVRLGITVGAAMFCSMGFASSFGAFVPMTLNRLGIDPAVAAGPFVTTSNDLSASLIYFSVCFFMLRS
ncbi:MAG: magnesium transporter [Lentisphaeria bacterium]|nr:magnesium transporter [Lentisphaeria bacterium]